MKSPKPKDDSGDQPRSGHGRDTEADFKGEKRSAAERALLEKQKSETIDVKTWLSRLPGGPRSQDIAILSPAELARAERFVQGRDAARFIGARAALRRVIGDFVGMPPESLIFKYTPEGKPKLANIDRAPFFNISHSRDIVLIGLCSQACIGIDIEALRPVEVGLVERFFSPAEQDALACLSGDHWLRGFYRCWTRKEAFIKGLGQGLALPLNQFDVSFDETAKLLSCAFAPIANWQLFALDAGRDFEAAVAVKAAAAQVRITVHLGDGVCS